MENKQAYILCGVAIVVVLALVYPVVAGALLGVGLLVGGIYTYLTLQHKFIEVQHAKNKAHIIHTSDTHIVYMLKGETIIQELKKEQAMMLPLKRLHSGGDGGEGPVIPTFAEMVKIGLIGQGKPRVLGFDEGGDEMKTKLTLTTGIGGVNGTGKTVTTLYTILSTLLIEGGNARLIVTDPHMHGDTGEGLAELLAPLSGFYLTLEEVRSTVPANDKEYLALLDELGSVQNPNMGGTDLSGWVRICQMELERRKYGKKGAKWMIVMDEFSSLMGRDKEIAKKVPEMLEALAQEARKFNMIAILIGQNWKANRSGGTELRNSVGAWYGHRMNENVAKLILPSDSIRSVASLQKGQAVVVSDTGDWEVLRVPYTTKQDAITIAQMFGHVTVTEIEKVDPNATTIKMLGEVW